MEGMIIQTERLYFRQFLQKDLEGIWALDSDPEVHKYLGNQPLTSKEQIPPIIKSIQDQYERNGIGRWAAFRKEDDEFIGWSGLKYIDKEEDGILHSYDIGYRFIKEYWGMGYATESAKAGLAYGFNVMKLPLIYGIAHVDNLSSNKVLKKIGLNYVGEIEFFGEPHFKYELNRDSYLKLDPKFK